MRRTTSSARRSLLLPHARGPGCGGRERFSRLNPLICRPPECERFSRHGVGLPPRGQGLNENSSGAREPAPGVVIATASSPEAPSEERGELVSAADAFGQTAASGGADVGLLAGGGELVGAEAAYRHADELGDAVAASNLGVVLEGRGDLEEAEAAYRRADERGDASGAFNLAGLLAERGDLAGAAGAYWRAAGRGDVDARYELGLLFEQLGRLTGADAAYRQADAHGHAKGAFRLAGLLAARGDLEGAEAGYRRAEERGDAAAASDLGVLLEEQGDLEGAEAAYRRADERGDASGAFNLAGLLAERGNSEGAAQAYWRAAGRGDAEAARNLALLLEQAGDLIPRHAADHQPAPRGPATELVEKPSLVTPGVIGEIDGQGIEESEAIEATPLQTRLGGETWRAAGGQQEARRAPDDRQGPIWIAKRAAGSPRRGAASP